MNSPTGQRPADTGATAAKRKLRSDSLVLRNSMWVGLQPLILNVVSIFVTGYIARALGQTDYGKFVFAFAFVALLMPVCDLGLRAVTVRDIAADRERGLTLLGKIFSLRLILSTLAVVLLIVLVNVMKYPASTRLVVYIAGITLLTRTAATTLFDIFQAYERMQYIAISNFISGTLLTAASVVVLLMGFRLIGLTLVNVAGSAVLFLSILFFYFRFFPPVRLDFDRRFWLESLKKGMPFFASGVLLIINYRFGVILLSKVGGDASVGQYGAAFSLLERLNVISDSLCTAIFPTLAALFAARELRELNSLLGKYTNYLLMIGLPLAVGTTLLAPEIINLIFGDKYVNSGIILAVLSWNLPFFFLASLFGYCLGSIRLQPLAVRVGLVATAVNIILSLILIPRLHALGVAIGYVSFGVVASVGSLIVLSRVLEFRLDVKGLLMIVLANAVLALCVLVLKEINWVLSIFGGALAYLGALMLLRALKRDDWNLIRAAVTRQRA